MKNQIAMTIRRTLLLGVAGILIFSACTQRPVAVPATATPEPTATATPEPTATPSPTPLPTPTNSPKKTVIPPTPEVVAAKTEGMVRIGLLTDAMPKLDSQQSRLSLALNGTGKANKALKGNLEVGLNRNSAKQQTQLSVGGDLLNPLLADQLRGFSARGLTLYALNDQTYALINTLLTVCVKMKPAQLDIGEVERGLSLDAFVQLVAPDGTFPGALVGEETINGMATKHYSVDTVTIKKLAEERGIRDINLTQGDIWLAAQGDYVVRMNLVGDGTLRNLAGSDFVGGFNVLVEILGLNNSPEVTLPSNCNRAIELP